MVVFQVIGIAMVVIVAIILFVIIVENIIEHYKYGNNIKHLDQSIIWLDKRLIAQDGEIRALQQRLDKIRDI